MRAVWILSVRENSHPSKFSKRLTGGRGLNAGEEFQAIALSSTVSVPVRPLRQEGTQRRRACVPHGAACKLRARHWRVAFAGLPEFEPSTNAAERRSLG